MSQQTETVYPLPTCTDPSVVLVNTPQNAEQTACTNCDDPPNYCEQTNTDEHDECGLTTILNTTSAVYDSSEDDNEWIDSVPEGTDSVHGERKEQEDLTINSSPKTQPEPA